jgi:hypothetical protein
VDDVITRDVIDRAEDLEGYVGRAERVERALALDHVLEGLALDELHREEELPVLAAHVIDLDEVLVRELADEAGLDEEALLELLVVQPALVEDLQGDEAVHGDLLGLEDDAQAALAELAVDLVALDGPLPLLVVLAEALVGEADRGRLVVREEAVLDGYVLEAEPVLARLAVLSHLLEHVLHLLACHEAVLERELGEGPVLSRDHGGQERIPDSP